MPCQGICVTKLKLGYITFAADRNRVVKPDFIAGDVEFQHSHVRDVFSQSPPGSARPIYILLAFPQLRKEGDSVACHYCTLSGLYLVSRIP